jgi:hypothetical protein
LRFTPLQSTLLLHLAMLAHRICKPYVVGSPPALALRVALGLQDIVAHFIETRLTGRRRVRVNDGSAINAHPEIRPAIAPSTLLILVEHRPDRNV